MDIASRNQDIVARRVGGETLDAIGTHYGISRQRVKQLFDANASPDDIARINAPPPPPPPSDFPKDEDRIRIHVPSAKSTNINQKQIRAGVRRWLDGEFKISMNARGKSRIDLIVASGMHVKLSVKCTSENIPLASAVRGIIDYLERENAQGHE